jgi:vanadium chloroperoxidase
VRGHHRSDPDHPGQPFHGAFYGARSKGFAVTSRHELVKPPFDNAEYLKALREVRGRGIAPELMGTLPGSIAKRTNDQTVIGLYWGYDGAEGLGTPPRLYNHIVRQVAIARGNTEAQNARLFALVNTAMADAAILAWDQKYIHDFWRPVLGVREHDLSMTLGEQAENDLSDDTDIGWLPLGAPATNSTGKNFTPPFPAYPSGHATFGAAALHITRRFYGVASGNRQPDNLFDNLDFVSDELNGVNRDVHGTVRPRHVRKFPNGLWQMILENGRSRVFLGVHWVFDAFAVDGSGNPDLSRNIGGVPLGLTIADDIFNSGMDKSSVGPRP